jgi:hypothetical protein
MSTISGFSEGSSGGAEASKKRRSGRTRRSRNKKTLDALGAGVGASRSAAAAIALAGPSRFCLALPPARQPLAYISINGYTTFIALVLAGCGDRLRLPSESVEGMEGREIACAILQECSTGQPSYDIEVYYDGEVLGIYQIGIPAT